MFEWTDYEFWCAWHFSTVYNVNSEEIWFEYLSIYFDCVNKCSHSNNWQFVNFFFRIYQSILVRNGTLNKYIIRDENLSSVSIYFFSPNQITETYLKSTGIQKFEFINNITFFLTIFLFTVVKEQYYDFRLIFTSHVFAIEWNLQSFCKTYESKSLKFIFLLFFFILV